eukprot:TRINITY_DN1279_c0_g2_i1.p1 TRINITY_DN1279_c0_g2~~TRINITY_DN1279_c0_g2_i1.p1  ORF type:complete len:127 (+),score=28.16 TRINITY_DN1279_c0_g2_i1:31-381(+)
MAEATNAPPQSADAQAANRMAKVHQSTLLAIAPIVQHACLAENQAFMLCKAQGKHPSECLREGRDVTKCGYDVLQKAEGCKDALFKFSQCLEYKNMDYTRCKKERAAFEAAFAKLK